MFSEASVSHSVQGGMGFPACITDHMTGGSASTECDFMPVRRTMSGKNPIGLVTFKTCQTKCLVDYLASLGYICCAKIPQIFQPRFAWHIVSYLFAYRKPLV